MGLLGDLIRLPGEVIGGVIDAIDPTDDDQYNKVEL